ncbi:class I SAM-dependent methyltransferase [Streptomyces sp. PT12]|uniref:class I SAM-dependent DNA methyltransferase n=1 Tax=Streptomyces sp. PT12 TaxID=1510197 RepID=UPI000DE4DE31|nr:class I SAM-dependent methyltransferase [Streptomyces sp. PT12]RBM20723.1 hypothetical protein DEH69_07080 [Streptomyces sp. PT12]
MEGCRTWSATYDDAENPALDFDGPVAETPDTRPVGTAIDAARGTGRWTAMLAERGYRVPGVDSSPDMLARAGERVPGAAFLSGDLHRLPFDDGSGDLVTCALALGHDRVALPACRSLSPGPSRRTPGARCRAPLRRRGPRGTLGGGGDVIMADEGEVNGHDLVAEEIVLLPEPDEGGDEDADGR